jgi:ABC-type antimicrobial peptide transport system permease subunit
MASQNSRNWVRSRATSETRAPFEGVGRVELKRSLLGASRRRGSLASYWPQNHIAIPYDIFYGVVRGTRTAFQIGLIVTSLTVLIGGTLGSISAFTGGWVDKVIQRVVESFLAFPFLHAALTLAAVLAPAARLDERIPVEAETLLRLAGSLG